MVLVLLNIKPWLKSGFVTEGKSFSYLSYVLMCIASYIIDDNYDVL